jgi:DNA gyrase subunit B
LKPIIIALGAGIGDSFDIAKLRYHRIIIMADADVDGSHIRTLLLTFFYRYYEPLIRSGYIYIAQPPLYRIQKNKEVAYAYTEEEKNRLVAEMGDKAKAQDAKMKTAKKTKEGEEVIMETDESAESGSEVGEKIAGLNLQRYKGLGEMNPGQLWETTMDPSGRVMKQVKIEDAEAADRVFDILMGSEVEPRRRFIQTHAKSVKNLDV